MLYGQEEVTSIYIVVALMHMSERRALALMSDALQASRDRVTGYWLVFPWIGAAEASPITDFGFINQFSVSC